MTTITPAKPPQPWAHQTRALEFIRDKPGAMLAMEMGTGKTRVAIDHMEELEARRTLVLAPLSVVDHVWPREIRTHGRRPTTIISLGDKFPNVRAKLKQAVEGLALATARKGPAVVIVNYESACREPLAEWLKNIHWDLFIMDEAHRLKSPSGQTSRFTSQLADRSARRLALTGTPMPHSPMDIYAQYRAIDKRVYGVSYRAFKTRYAEFETVGKMINTRDERGNPLTYMPQAISGYQNLDELNQKFYTLAFRVTAAETLDLPGAIETYTHVELGRKARQLYDEMAVSFIAELETGEKITAANALARLVRFQQLTSGFASTPDGKIIEVDKAKANALADILDGLPRREPVVIFVRFQNDLDTIARIAEKMKRPHYEISGRVKNLDEWNTHGGVLAVQIQAGGLVLQRRFIRQGDFRDQFGPEPYCHERTAMAHSCPNTKDQTPYHANRRCNTSWGLKVICGAAESFWASSKFLKCAFHLGIGLGEERISSSFSSPPQ